MKPIIYVNVYLINSPVSTGHTLNVHKSFRRRPGRLLNVLSTFNFCPVSTGSIVPSAQHVLKRGTETFRPKTPRLSNGILLGENESMALLCKQVDCLIFFLVIPKPK